MGTGPSPPLLPPQGSSLLPQVPVTPGASSHSDPLQQPFQGLCRSLRPAPELTQLVPPTPLLEASRHSPRPLPGLGPLPAPFSLLPNPCPLKQLLTCPLPSDSCFSALGPCYPSATPSGQFTDVLEACSVPGPRTPACVQPCPGRAQTPGTGLPTPRPTAPLGRQEPALRCCAFHASDLGSSLADPCGRAQGHASTGLPVPRLGSCRGQP